MCPWEAGLAGGKRWQGEASLAGSSNKAAKAHRREVEQEHWCARLNHTAGCMAHC